MIEDSIICALRKRYENLHPLVFNRSVEKAESAMELFDILEAIPNTPFSWDEKNRRWARCLDFNCINKLKTIIRE